MFISVVIPTYNRLPILKKCLSALERQNLINQIEGYEILVIDDGSTDGTISWINKNHLKFPHVCLFEQSHGGPALARNFGIKKSQGDLIVFIDSDLVVTKNFLSAHAKALTMAWARRGNRNCFTYGQVINTTDFDSPTLEPFKLQDNSWAYFATGNVAIDKVLLEKSGLFDPSFQLYGWEDLELGERLRSMGVELIKCPKAVGYHWHPALSIDQIPHLVRIEQERAKMGLIFYRKHPTLRVRFIIQYTILHRLLWETLTLFGLINHKNIQPLLAFLLKMGYPSLAMEILRIPLNLIGVRSIYREIALSRSN